MAQLFSPRSNLVMRGLLAGIAGAVVLVAGAGYAVTRSGWFWDVGAAPPQPVPFSHQLHAGDLGVDCAFCHSSAGRTSLAGLPTAETCMTCHSGLPVGGAFLAPVRNAYETGEPLLWSRVHRVADHARFHHGVHVSAGLGCAECHGAVETMPQTVKTETLSMKWCLDCHQESSPARTGATDGTGRQLQPLADCSVCHR
jgi:Cytochrome c7 and related cytochrome c